MACVGIEIINDKLPESFTCTLYIHKNGCEIVCTCVNTDTCFGSVNDVHFTIEEFAWDMLLNVITASILKVLEKD